METGQWLSQVTHRSPARFHTCLSVSYVNLQVGRVPAWVRPGCRAAREMRMASWGQQTTAGDWLLVPAQFHSLATPKVPGEAMSRFGVALLLSVRVAARSLPLGRGVLVLWWVCVAGRLSVLR